MTLMVKEEIRDLLKHTGVCVSIYMPTHRRGGEVQQDSIRLKNLLRKAEEQLLAQSMRATAVGKLLSPALRLQQDTHFWRHQGDGLALFLSRDLSRHVRLPEPVDELVVVTERFHMKPLLPLLSGDGRFYILALSQNQLRLLEGSRDTIKEIDLEDVPRSLAEALKHENPEKQLQFRTQGPRQAKGGRGASFHGHGGGADDAEHKKGILRYLRMVDEGIREFLKGKHAPLVFAGVDYLFPLYKEANSYPDLVGDPLLGNPDDLPQAELHSKAWNLVRPHFAREQQEAAEQFARWAGTGRTADNVRDALTSAHQGRVEVLFVPLGKRSWGTFDEEAEEAVIHESREPGDEDLLDRAALETLLNGGVVFAVKQEAMPADLPVAAVFRY